MTVFHWAKVCQEFTKRQRIVPYIHDDSYMVIECCQEINSAYVRTCAQLQFKINVFHTKKTTEYVETMR